MRNVVTLEKSALDGPLPFGDESVDVMRAAHVLHLSGNPDALMTDIWKALRPGGALVFSAPVEAKARLLCYADEEYAEGGPRFEVEELREADGVVLAVFSKHGAEPSRKSAVPDRLLALYRRHLAEGGFGEAGDVSVSHVASTAGGDLYRVKDGYGEWYFAIQGQQARWLAQKMPDVQAYDVAPELSELFSKDAVEALGMGDAAWDEALAGYLRKYSPDQPRLEVGPNAGQWIEYPSQENAAVLRSAADRLNRIGGAAGSYKTAQAALVAQLGEKQAKAVLQQFARVCGSNHADRVRREVDRRLHGESVEDLHKEGIEGLVGLLENAPVSRQTLYRGMGLDAKQYAEFQQRYQEGTEFDMGMSSFSSSQEIARAFATINSVHRVGGGQVIVQTEGKVKALRVEGVSPWTKEKEWLAIGRFKVTSVKSAGNVTTITIRQTAGIKAPPKESLKSYVRPLLRTGRSKVQDDEEMPSVSTKEMEFEPAKFWRLFAEMRVSPQELGMPAKATKHADVSDADVRVGKPYAGPGDDKLPEWVQKLPEEKRKQWVAVWNDVYAQALKDGMNQREAEGKAFRVASGVVKSEYRVFKAEEERRFTLGIVYSPDEEDAHGDMMTPDEVEAMAWRALAALAHGGMRVGLEHQVFEVKGEAPGMLVESYIYRGPDTVMNGVPVKTGTWIAGVIWHPLLWEQVKSGEIRGFSWAGLAHRE